MCTCVCVSSLFSLPYSAGASDYTAACDVYSFALVVCEMLTNKVPFEDVHEFAIINRVGKLGDRPELPPDQKPDQSSSSKTEAEAEVVDVLIGWDDEQSGGGGGETICTGYTMGKQSDGGGDDEATRTGIVALLRGSLSLLVRKCWAQAPEDRPAFTEVVRYLERCRVKMD